MLCIDNEILIVNLVTLLTFSGSGSPKKYRSKYHWNLSLLSFDVNLITYMSDQNRSSPKWYQAHKW